MTSRLAPALAALVLVAAGCGGDDESAGGADDLPQPLPGTVSFAPATGGLSAPDFSAELVDGTEVTASDLWRDRPVVLVFTASWCERCRAVHRDAARVVAEHPGAALLGVVGEDDLEAAADYAKELDLGRPVGAASEQVWLDYAAREPPVVVLVGPGGKVLRGWPGGVDPAVLDEQLDALAG
jgi:cytochrome c biogenesis protein CcmG/thiol:disulfide interchange protein DsbE